MTYDMKMDCNTLRKVQLVQLEIVKEIKRVCEKEQINYFLDSGTLLGAVRHGGFIPWDDDLDVGMLREEYEHFLTVAAQELRDEYELVEWKKDNGYPHQFCKVIKKGTVYLEEKAMDGEGKNGIYVDVFPYDAYPENKFLQKQQGLMIMSYRAIIRAKCHYKTWIKYGKRDWIRWLKNLPFRGIALFFSKKSLINRYEKIAVRYNSCPSSMYFPQGISKYGKWLIPRECFEKFTVMMFEDELFQVPGLYDTYLKHVYGDYMKLPPESERGNRHGIIEVSFGKECKDK